MAIALMKIDGVIGARSKQPYADWSEIDGLEFSLAYGTPGGQYPRLRGPLKVWMPLDKAPPALFKLKVGRDRMDVAFAQVILNKRGEWREGWRMTLKKAAILEYKLIAPARHGDGASSKHAGQFDSADRVYIAFDFDAQVQMQGVDPSGSEVDSWSK
jgi:hypothetical protein